MGGNESGLAAVSTRNKPELAAGTGFEDSAPVKPQLRIAGADTNVHLAERARNNGSVRESPRPCKVFFPGWTVHCGLPAFSSMPSNLPAGLMAAGKRVENFADFVVCLFIRAA